MPGSYTLELELFATYSVAMPVLEVYEDGAFANSYSVSSNGTSVSLVINYGGALPTSLQFTFLNDAAEGGRQIEIRSVKIDGYSINTNNYLSTAFLNEGNSSTVDVNSSDFIFGTQLPPAGSFTTGATQTYDGTANLYNDYTNNTDQVFDMLGGRDVAYLGGGDDSVSGGAGDDILRGGAGTDLLFGDAGNDRIYGGDDADEIYGGDNDDRLHGEGGDDLIFGNSGADTLVGHSGADTLVGGAGDDRLNGGADNDILYGGADNDRLAGGQGNDSLDGEAGNDNLYGGEGNDIAHGGAGTDIIYGQAGQDILHGDDGDDDLFGGTEDDTLNGGDGADLLEGDEGVDTLNGDIGADILKGGAGADTLNGGSGNDILHGHSINGRDIYTILQANPNVVYNADTNSFYQYVSSVAITWDAANAAASATILSGMAGYLAVVTSQEEFDYLTTLTGIGAGNDHVHLGGSDIVTEGEWFWLYGPEAGAQFSSGSTAVNNMFAQWRGGQPNSFGGDQDVLHFHGTAGFGDLDSATADGNIDGYLIEWNAGLMNDDNAIDAIDGGDGNDTLYGYGGDDVLIGGDDNDVLFGGSDNDNLDGDAGTDVLYGQEGDDDLDGGADNDTLFGGGGNDVIQGGTGNDTIYGDAQVTATAADLIAYYRFDETSGTTAADSSGNGNTATYYGGTPTWETSGQVDGAVRGNTNDGFEAGTFDVNGSGLTIAAWINWETDTQDPRIVSKTSGTAAANHDWAFFIDNNTGGEDRLTLRMTTVNGFNEEDLVGYDMAQHMGEWTHVAITYDDTTDLITYYVNGASVGTDTHDSGGAVATGSGETVAIGNNPNGAGNRYFDGLLDEVRIYERGLDSTEIADIYADFTPDEGDDTIDGGAGDDTIYGGSGDDVIHGDGDNDTIYGGEGNDTLYGDAGDDTIYSESVLNVSIANILAANTNLTYNATNGNFYEYVAGAVNYATADAAAIAATVNGVSAHLATVLTSSENTFVSAMVGGSDAWLGGTDSGTEGVWIWDKGPGAGQQFSSVGTAVNGMFEDWNGAEPQTTPAARDYIDLDNAAGWQAEQSSNTSGYLLEWEGTELLRSYNDEVTIMMDREQTIYMLLRDLIHLFSRAQARLQKLIQSIILIRLVVISQT